MGELRLMKGNEALAEAAIRAGMDGYFGYPITPQSEILEYLTREAYNRTQCTVLQAESEIASINMVYGAAGTGARVMTTSSSPGISLMQEGISYIAGAELPCLLVNINRGGPGLGTIQPSQGDYFQSVKGGGHGDYRLIVLAPATVQEMADFVLEGWEMAEKYRNPVLILADGALGQMMEKVELREQQPRGTRPVPDWATVGKTKDRERNVITSLFIKPEEMEQVNLRLQQKYKLIESEITRVEELQTDDADFVIVAYGLSARIGSKVMELLRDEGMKVGLIRPISLWPYPYATVSKAAEHVKGFLSLELNAGQMVEDVRLAVNGRCPVGHYGRMGGIIPSPEEVADVIKKMYSEL
ncbi:MAG: 3-methyl-2-oxobutanoate dehydrogenase subunit VorB [Ignavibacteria bacterium]|nr:MAG: 3-methyl-2-oxobutanoate dehydrogenase subunit VorB [Ignavibacteria bacterium]